MDKIRFLVTNRFGDKPEEIVNTVLLIWDEWNDYSYFTTFGLDYIDSNGEIIEIGAVRIAYFGQEPGRKAKRLQVGKQFYNLDSDHFSLGTEDTYYENLNKLGEDLRLQILNGLNDIALNPNIYEKAIKENVTQQSLLRDSSSSTVVTQYRHIANGGARLSNYSFRYYFPINEVETEPSRIEFNVLAEHNPPTNIQVIIGRNGVGKSHLLNGMIDSIINIKSSEAENGKFIFKNRNNSFSNVICVTYSAFDEFEFHSKKPSSDIKYHYVGLKTLETIYEESKTPHNNNNLRDDFTSSIGLIISTAKVHRWKTAIRQLESDPVFKDENLIELIEHYDSENLKPIQQKFSRLSSGHKVILLTITKLVQLVQEKSLVFFDEPETHLHPPLLSSFIRAISALMINRNAVCIMTTHSPIALQEVPRSCVFKLSKSDNYAKFERPRLETFGENVGVLTNDVFELEVTDSGFYNILKELVMEKENYEAALDVLNHELGIEGRAILRSLFFDKKRN